MRREVGKTSKSASTTAVGFAVLALVLVSSASAAGGKVGFEGDSFAGVGTSSSATVSKPESKIWWNDGRWWGSMWDAGRSGHWIFRLDQNTQRWENTGIRLDARPRSRADTLWDGEHLYVASHIHGSTYGVGYPSYLYRFSYSASGYTLDPGFPVVINDVRTEELVIDKDSTGTLWATWVYEQQVYVSRTLGTDTKWGTPFVVPTSGTTVDADDISTLIAFGGNKIGVMWSNQLDGAFYFAVHRDGDSDQSWQLSTALRGTGEADDHINLKTDSAGRVFAAVKTSRSGSLSPLIRLLVRSAGGDWTGYVVALKADAHTRPIVVLDETNGMLRVFATAAGKIYVKTSSLAAIAFGAGPGTPFIEDPLNLALNDATSAKQNPTPATGMVVLASNETTLRYWHNVVPIGPPLKPAARFAASPTAGTAPLAVSFTDSSEGQPTSWAWDFGDGSSSSERSPSHTYTQPGTYTVRLTVANSAGSDTLVMNGLIRVEEPPSERVVTATEDAEIRSASPDSKYGTSARLSVKQGTYRSYLKFSVPNLGGQVVVKARLRLFVTAASKDGGKIYPVSNNWAESSITWNNAPAVSGSPVGAAGPVALGSWIEVDLGQTITSSGTHSFAIADGTTTSAYYSSREGGNPPQLVLTMGQAAAPVADFGADVVQGGAPLTVTFADASQGGATAWTWGFGDGTTSNVRNPVHTYTEPGTYTVTLTVSNSIGSDTRTKAGYITVAAQPAERTVMVAEDAEVRSDKPDRSYGTNERLSVKAGQTTYRSYLKFILPDLGGRVVVAAKLRLYVTAASKDGGRIYMVGNDWRESTVTWSNAPALTGTPLGGAGSLTRAQWIDIDLRDAVREPVGTYSFAIADGSTTSAYYSSREGGNPAQLILLTAAP